MAKSLHSRHYKLLLDMLVEARTRSGLTQAELGERLGRPQPFISYIERGERRVDVIEFYAIMKALAVDPEEAFRDLTAKLPGTIKI